MPTALRLVTGQFADRMSVVENRNRVTQRTRPVRAFLRVPGGWSATRQ